MSKHTPGPLGATKRKTWRDRVCPHGNQVETWFQLDMAYCATPDCWRRTLAGVGLMPLRDKRINAELLIALKTLMGDITPALQSSYPKMKWAAAWERAEAAIAKAEGGE